MNDDLPIAIIAQRYDIYKLKIEDLNLDPKNCICITDNTLLYGMNFSRVIVCKGYLSPELRRQYNIIKFRLSRKK